jgi:hypothetical protein
MRYKALLGKSSMIGDRVAWVSSEETCKKKAQEFNSGLNLSFDGRTAPESNPTHRQLENMEEWRLRAARDGFWFVVDTRGRLTEAEMDRRIVDQADSMLRERELRGGPVNNQITAEVLGRTFKPEQVSAARTRLLSHLVAESSKVKKLPCQIDCLDDNE